MQTCDCKKKMCNSHFFLRVLRKKKPELWDCNCNSFFDFVVKTGFHSFLYWRIQYVCEYTSWEIEMHLICIRVHWTWSPDAWQWTWRQMGSCVWLCTQAGYALIWADLKHHWALRKAFPVCCLWLVVWLKRIMGHFFTILVNNYPGDAADVFRCEEKEALFLFCYTCMYIYILNNQHSCSYHPCL